MKLEELKRRCAEYDWGDPDMSQPICPTIADLAMLKKLIKVAEAAQVAFDESIRDVPVGTILSLGMVGLRDALAELEGESWT